MCLSNYAYGDARIQWAQPRTEAPMLFVLGTLWLGMTASSYTMSIYLYSILESYGSMVNVSCSSLLADDNLSAI